MNSSWFWAKSCIWSCFETLEFMGTHACMIFALFFMFLNFELKLVFNWLTFGLWFYQLIFKICCCFLENWPKRLSFDVLNAWFELREQIWKFQILASTLERRIPRSSDHLLFRAPLERRNSGSSVDCKLSSFWCTQMHARAMRPMLERRAVSHARASIERGFSTTSTFAFLQTARARKSTLEQPLCFGKLAQAREATLERDPYFQ